MTHVTASHEVEENVEWHVTASHEVEESRCEKCVCEDHVLTGRHVSHVVCPYALQIYG